MQMRIIKSKWVYLLIGIFCSNGFALNLIGPSDAELLKGHWEFGADYTKGEIGLDFDASSGSGANFDADETDIETISARIGYGLTDSFEMFTRLGYAQFDDSENRRDLNTDGYNCGLGFKTTVDEYYLLKFGIQAQVNWLDTNGDWTRSTRTGDADVKMAQIFIAGSANYQLADNWFMYGGPFLYLEKGEMKYDEKSPSTSISEKYDIDNQSFFGGYVGFQVHLPAALKLNLEYQITPSDSVFALSLVWRH